MESVISALPGWIGYFLLMSLFFNALFCLSPGPTHNPSLVDRGVPGIQRGADTGPPTVGAIRAPGSGNTRLRPAIA